MEPKDILVIKNKHHILKKLVLLIIIVIIAISAYTALLISISLKTDDQKYFFSLKAYIIETTSMEPELKNGDVIIVKKCDKLKDLKIGDIITFENRGEIITHRITKINYETGKISTKGDKNEYEDIEDIHFSDVFGSGKFIIHNFAKIQKITSNFLYWIIIFMIVIGLYLHSKRVARKRGIRRRKKKIEDRKSENIENSI